MVILFCLEFVFFKLSVRYEIVYFAAIALVAILSSLLRYYVTKSQRKAVNVLCGFGLAAFMSLVSFYVLVSLLHGVDPDRTTYVLAIISIIVFNAILASSPSSPGRQRLGLPLLYLVEFSLFILLIMRLFGPTLVPNAVMYNFRFGNFKTASLVLDDAGCTIARDHGLQEGPRCNFSDVIILSRLGSTYYVEKDGTSVCFTIPAEKILSWGVADKQSTDARRFDRCHATK
jgi:hypothetical protein